MRRRKFVKALAGGAGMLFLAPSCTVNGKYYSFDDIFGDGDADTGEMPRVASVGEHNLVFGEGGSSLRLDSAGHDLHELNQGEAARSLGGRTNDPSEFNYPVDAAFGANDSVYVLSKGNSNIRRVASDGSGTVFGKGQLNSPHDLTVGPDGNIYIADTLGHQICVFDPDGKQLRTIGDRKSLNGPRGIAITETGELHVADAGNACVQVFSPEGKPLRKYGRYGDNLGEFHRPNSIVVDRRGRVSVADPSTGFVSVFKTDGTFVGRFQPKDSSGDTVVPMRLQLTENGRLHICTDGHSNPFPTDG